MNEIINPSTLRQGAAPWNTEIVSFNQNVKLDLWGQSANDIVKIRRVRVQDGAIIHTSNQTCCIIPATKAQVKASKVVLRCDCDGSRPAELTTDVTSIILSDGAYVFEYSGSGFAAKTTVLTYEESKKEACDCACAQAPCLPVAIAVASTGMTSATVTVVSGSDIYGREVTVKLFNGENEYEQVGVNGDVLTFAGLQTNTTYSVVAENDCGNKDTKEVTTDKCPDVVITMAAAGTNAVAVTVTSGGTAWVEVGDAKQYVANGETATFSGLIPDTEYFATATSDCGSFVTAKAKTLPCPAVVLTQTANTPNSVTILSNIAATVTLGEQEVTLPDGGSYTFTGLKELTSYTVKAVTICGAKTVFNATTAACPAISLTQTSNTTGSINVTLVSGGTASVFVGGDEAILANGASYTFTNLTAGKNYTAKVISECGNKANFTIATAPCPAVDFTVLALSTTSLQVTAVAGMPLTISVASQGGAVLDFVDDVSSTVVFTDLPEGAIVTVKAVNECGKTKQLNVNLPDPIANPCPSFSLADASPFFKGFAYVAGDLIDPAATVAYRGGLIYPTTGEGHTVKVTALDGVTVIGYAVNKSDCANPCCTPVFNRTSVDGTIIDDTTNNYYIEGEVNKCDGTPVLPADRLFNKGSLKTCVNGQIVDLDCNMLVKTLPDCTATDCEINTLITQDSQVSGGGVCIGVGVNSYNPFTGTAVAQMRDFVSVWGDISFSGSNPPTHLPYTYTNNTGCPVLFEANLTGHTNAWAASGNQGTMGAAYHVSENLNYTLSNSFLTFTGVTEPNTSRHKLKITGSTGIGSGGGYDEETVAGARFRKVVPSGQSVTVYAQAMIIFFQSDPITNGTVVHTNMQLDIKVTKGAAYL
jgi:hypothetical protein